MKHIVFILLSVAMLVACGQSYEEKKLQTRQQRARQAREDSAALKIAVTPTLDCLPLYVAADYGLFGTLGADVRLKYYAARMDCDEAMLAGRVECTVTDLVRGQYIMERGMPLEYVAATDACWQLITNRNARIRNLKQLNDKMLAMTRYSATDLLGDYAVDSVKLKPEMVFRIQINDVNLRLKMLVNIEMDAMLLTEPQATAARIRKHPVLMDSRKLGLRLGAVAVRADLKKDTARSRQVDVLIKAYDMACDSINKYGVRGYGEAIARHCKVSREVVGRLPEDMKFVHAASPRKADIDYAEAWLRKRMESDATIQSGDGSK